MDVFIRKLVNGEWEASNSAAGGLKFGSLMQAVDVVDRWMRQHEGSRLVIQDDAGTRVIAEEDDVAESDPSVI